jgi:predicted secreted acid phosphatase
MLAGAATLSVAVGIGSYAVADASQDGEHGIENLSLAKEKVKQYYGDTGSQQPSPESSFAADVAAKRQQAKAKLAQALAERANDDSKPAIVLDVDDTTLSTYNYEVLNDFAYDREEAEQYVKENVMDPVFGMPELAQWAEEQGVEVFYLSARPEDQRSYTERDLAAGGFPDVRQDRVLLRDRANPPDYLEYCEPQCTTVQFRTGTRKHLESQGYDILLNVGDQRSDLDGGYGDHTVKLPNPMYILP